MSSSEITKSELDFNNTEIAFKHLSNGQMKRAYLLFNMMGNRALVMWGSKLFPFAMKFHLPVKFFVKHTLFEHFCGGESIDECQRKAEELSSYKIGAIVDYSVEGNQDNDSFDYVRDEILRTIDFSSEHLTPPFAVFKMTGLVSEKLLAKIQSGLALSANESSDYDKLIERVRKLCQRASEKSVRLMIDAEHYAFQQPVDDIAYKMMKEFNQDSAVIYNTLQMYRWDRLDHLKEAYQTACDEGYFLGIKVVRGAYLEKEREAAAEMGYPDPIQQSKEATDRDFDLSLDFCVEHLSRVRLFCGTHNERSILHLANLMSQHQLTKDDPRIVFSQLYGMSDNLSYNLAHQGYHVRKYLPYGPVKEVMPYLMRRAIENTSIQGQTGRELNLLRKEMNRRDW